MRASFASTPSFSNSACRHGAELFANPHAPFLTRPALGFRDYRRRQRPGWIPQGRHLLRGARFITTSNRLLIEAGDDVARAPRERAVLFTCAASTASRSTIFHH